MKSLMLALGSEGKHGLAGDTAVIKLHNLEDSLAGLWPTFRAKQPSRLLFFLTGFAL